MLLLDDKTVIYLLLILLTKIVIYFLFIFLTKIVIVYVFKQLIILKGTNFLFKF